jgi:hypothetical protein
MLNKVDTFEFNIFEIDKLVNKKTMFFVLNHILNKYGYITDLLIEEKYVNFITEIINGYNRKIPYHHDLHGTDVLQTTYIFISQGNLTNVNYVP